MRHYHARLVMKRNFSKANDRPEYIGELIKEFYTTKSLGAKKEVLANLANFAYNPVNYEYLRNLQVTDVFLNCLEESDNDLLQFALSGICNLSADPENKSLIIQKGGIAKISKFLEHNDVKILLPVLTSLIYLVGPSSVESITTEEIIKIVLRHQASTDKRLKNLATIFLDDICPKERVAVISSK